MNPPFRVVRRSTSYHLSFRAHPCGYQSSVTTRDRASIGSIDKAVLLLRDHPARHAVCISSEVEERLVLYTAPTPYQIPTRYEGR